MAIARRLIKAARELIWERETPQELPDPTPLHIPGLERPLSIQEEMKQFIRQEISNHAQTEGFESFEEADDFEEEDGEADLLTDYTVIELRQDERPYDLDGDREDKETDEGSSGDREMRQDIDAKEERQKIDDPPMQAKSEPEQPDKVANAGS